MNYTQKVEWNRLDNASKIFPAVCSYKDPKVFRIACELYELVDADVLQKALDMTIECFPLYKSILRRGVFWFYFETGDVRPLVEEEASCVCAPIYRKYERNLLFRVLYYKKRINLEVFHALSDGTGALWFMKTLVYNYLTCKHKELASKVNELEYNASISEKMDDSFMRHYHGRDFKKQFSRSKSEKRNTDVYRVNGSRNDENRIKVIEGSMSAKGLLEKAHEYNTTLTILLAAIFIKAIYQDMPVRKRRRCVVLSVPINLRQFFKSETVRNFFSTMNVVYNPQNTNVESELKLNEVIDSISSSFKKELTEERLNAHLHWLMSFERNPFTRVAPLPIKIFSLRVANSVMDMGITATVSNVGRIELPSEFEDYIFQFSIIPNVKRPQMAICTYGDRLVVTFASPFKETELQKSFFRTIAQMGIRVELSSNCACIGGKGKSEKTVRH